ncbi:hypothetical protein [Microbacterium sp. A93]|uniref:hypothetical protein n=1 Tax=Microbacterium sp. A93 TaxID=3450716 RepID=UPI003F42EEA1
MRHGRRLHPAILLLTLSLVLTGCSAGTRQTVVALEAGADDALRLMGREAGPADFTKMSTTLDDLLGQVPVGRQGLSASEQAIVDRVARRSVVLRSYAAALGASDEVMGLISDDAVLLVSGALQGQPTPAFKQHLDTVAGRLLKETTCTLVAREMSELTAASAAPVTGVPLPAQVPAPEHVGLWGTLQGAVTAAGYLLGDANDVVDFAGLSSTILATAADKVGKVKTVMDAAEWADYGAMQVYLRHCV